MPASGAADPDHDLMVRCHENSVEAYRVFARTTAGGRLLEHDGVVLTDCRASDSMGNVIAVTRPVEDGEATVTEAEAFYAAGRQPWILFAVPEAVPSLERATLHRLTDEGWFSGLLLDPIPAVEPPLPDGVEVRRVETLGELQEYERAAARAYGVPSGPVDTGWLDYPGFSFHLAYFRGVPVAAATLVASHGLAGIVYVGTVPEARGRGFGRAVVGRAIETGRLGGLTASALWATPMGRPMYEGMGFRPNTRYRIWSAPHSPLPEPFRSR